MYHGFTAKDMHSGIENYTGNHVNIEIFKKQVEYLKKFYNIITLEQLVGYYYIGKKLPNNSVVITFDDGYKTNYNLAFPILKELNIPVTIFLATDFIENKNFLWVDRLEYAINCTQLNNFKVEINKYRVDYKINNYNNKLKCVKECKATLKQFSIEKIEEIVTEIENRLDKNLATASQIPNIYLPLEWSEINVMLASKLISLGNHTHKHAILTKCTDGEVKNELLLSRKIIKEQTGSDPKYFCYPNGQARDFSQRTKEILQEQGFNCGITTISGTNNKRSDVFFLKRYYTSNNKNLSVFIIILSGISGLLNKLRKIVIN